MRMIPYALLLALGACSPAASGTQATGLAGSGAATARHPQSGLEVIALTVIHDGKRLPFRVEVARSEEEQARGLMFRTALAPDEGMLFPRKPPSQAAFWMKNTVIPLDIIFVGIDGRISNIEEMAVPYSLEPRQSAGAAMAVLELNGGRAAELGIVAGDRVEW